MGTKTSLTLDDFMRLPDDGMRHELSEGELIVMPPASLTHARVATRIMRALMRCVDERGLGEVFGNGGFQLAPETVRQPDVSFLSSSRIEASQDRRIPEGAPDLAVEIVSPSDSAEDLNLKVRQYLTTGAKAVWVVYPTTRQVHVFEAPFQVRVLTETDRLDAPQLFPGWSVPVSDILV